MRITSKHVDRASAARRIVEVINGCIKRGFLKPRDFERYSAYTAALLRRRNEEPEHEGVGMSTPYETFTSSLQE